MPSWTNATPQATPAGVILRASALHQRIHRDYALPDGPAAAVVARFWRLRWRLDDEVTVPSSLVPDFGSNLTLEVNSGRPGTDAGPVVTGVSLRRFDVHLAGTGSVIGVKFHPGALTGLSGVPADDLAERTTPAADVLHPDVVRAFEACCSAPEGEQVDDLVRCLAGVRVVDPGWEQARRIVADARHPDAVSVRALATRAGVTPRTLQRLLRRYVGVGPKRIITRFRLHDAVAALDSANPPPLAELATHLGFYDQAHFTREFTRFVGATPAAYRSGAGSAAGEPREP